MKKYFVLIDGEKFDAMTKADADALLIDAMLSGIQGIDWNIYESKPSSIEVLKSIKVNNWYCGIISAFYAWSNNCTISKNDANRVRKALKKYGYTCNILGGIICNLSK